MAAEPENRSLETVVQELGEEFKHLIRAEVELARKELAGDVRELGLSAGMVGAAGLLGVLSAGTATAGLVLLLARRPRPWLAALTVSTGYAGAGLLLAREARRRVKEVGVPVPEKTIDTLKDSAQRVAASSKPTSGPAAPDQG